MKTSRVFFLCLLAVVASWPSVQGQVPPKAKSAIPPGIRAVAFSPDGKLLAVAAGEPEEVGEATVWDLATNKPRFVHREQRGIPSVAFSPDGKTLAVGTFTENAHLLDVATGKVLRTLPGHGESARGVAFSPDGQTLAISSYDGSIRLWDIATAKVRLRLTGHRDWVYAVAWSPDGKRLVSGSADHSVRLWNAETGEALHTFQQGGICRRVGFTRDGRLLFGADWDGNMRVREVKTGEVRASAPGTDGAACTPDGQLWAVGGRSSTVRIHQLILDEITAEQREHIRRLIRQLDAEDFDAREAATRELAKAGLVAEPELRKALKESSSAEVRMRARRLRTAVRNPEPQIVLRGHTGEVESVEFSPDGRLLASGGKDGSVRLWEVGTWKQTATLSLPR